MNLLAIDSAGPECSVALASGRRVIERVAGESRAYARHVLALIDEVLGEADLKLSHIDVLGFGEGPGGLTGVRVAASVVQGLAMATNSRVVAVSNLLASAYAVARDEREGMTVLVAHDAGAGAVCVQSFALRGDAVVALAAPAVVTPENIEWPAGPLCVTGSGTAQLTLPAAAAWIGGAPQWASARDLMAVMQAGEARDVAAQDAQPLYLRHPVDAKITL
jgi:tRNA threonylcarbamoyladenosine biosynthesis protein TsaB